MMSPSAAGPPPITKTSTSFDYTASPILLTWLIFGTAVLPAMLCEGWVSAVTIYFAFSERSFVDALSRSSLDLALPFILSFSCIGCAWIVSALLFNEMWSEVSAGLSAFSETDCPKLGDTKLTGALGELMSRLLASWSTFAVAAVRFTVCRVFWLEVDCMVTTFEFELTLVMPLTFV